MTERDAAQARAILYQFWGSCQANRRAERRAESHTPPDYAGVNKVFRQQKASLTRACRNAVREWSQPPFNGAWPDDWARWQRALDDALPWNARVLLEDLPR